MGRRFLGLEAHPHIRRSAQQQAQHITGVGRNAIHFIVEDALRPGQAPLKQPGLGSAGRGLRLMRRSRFLLLIAMCFGRRGLCLRGRRLRPALTFICHRCRLEFVACGRHARNIYCGHRIGNHHRTAATVALRRRHLAARPADHLRWRSGPNSASLAEGTRACKGDRRHRRRCVNRRARDRSSLRGRSPTAPSVSAPASSGRWWTAMPSP